MPNHLNLFTSWLEMLARATRGLRSASGVGACRPVAKPFILKIVMVTVALLLCLPNGEAQTPAVPSLYQSAYSTMTTDISNFNASINANWNGNPSQVTYSSQLQTANSDLTTNLLAPNYYQITVLSELNALQALGTQAITFHINFPALYQPYYSNSSEYQQYLNFYTTLVSEIRSRGLQVIIENTIAIVYPGLNSGSFTSYYQSLDWPTYMQQRAGLAASIAQILKPDYMVLVAEPDTEANATGQANANTVSGSTQMLQGMLSAMQQGGVSNVQFSAGCGTWNPLFMQYIQSFITIPSLPLIDMHIYPLNFSNLPNAMTAANMINSAGKQATMSEVWTWKESDSDYLANLPYTEVYARDVFSFWQPLDASFLQSISNFANYEKFAYISPFWSHYFAAYLDYNVYGGQADSTLITTASSASTAANIVGSFTPTGLAWENLLVSSPDLTPPLAPAAPTSISVSYTGATIAWNPSNDNVGVAAYDVYRNGVLAGTVSSPLSFYDSSLSPKTTYSYTVAAFDAAGNLSPQSAPLLVTTFGYPDKTPPSVPSGISVTPYSDVQVSLVWNASADNAAVLGYEIYRGNTQSGITAWATSPSPGYLDLKVSPSTTYYYQIDAYDTSGNHSARSAVYSGTSLPDTTPPTAPGNLTGVVQGSQAVIKWTAATDDYRIGNYNVYRGTSSNGLQVYGSVSASTLTFTDSHAVSGKTYYYSVVAYDVARNTSSMPTPVAVQMP